MKVVIGLLVTVLVLSCVGVGASNQFHGLDNVPMSFREVLKTAGEMGNMNKYFAFYSGKLSMNLIKCWEAFTFQNWDNYFAEADSFMSFLDAWWKYSFATNFVGLIVNFLVASIIALVESFICISLMVSIIFKVIFGVAPDTSTLLRTPIVI